MRQLLLVFLVLSSPWLTAQDLRLERPAIVVDTANPLNLKAAHFLQEEIQRRSKVRVAVGASLPEGDATPVVMDTAAKPSEAAGAIPEGLAVPEGAEGYALWATGDKIVLRGRDNRGLLFAAGKLIQLMQYSEKALQLPANVHIATAPKYSIRAHQLGYRNTANTYDLWDVETYDQYIRDMIIFGANGVELIPPKEPGEKDSPKLMRTDMWEMNAALCELISSYGIDVWMWSEVGEDLAKPEEAEEALKKRRRLFESCSRIDHFFVPGGDGGENPAEYLLPWLGDLKKVLNEVHPEAKLWVSNQTFTEAENDYTFELLASGEAGYLEGMIYGPWTEMSLEEMRERTPKEFKLRTYPDITHLVRCQFPVPDWDPAFAHTLGREAICPRPHDISHIHNKYAPLTDGFGTYSDGAHDDFNKMVWSVLGWDPETPVQDITNAYAKVFFGDASEALGAQALYGLEQNWRGPILENESIPATLKQWEQLWDEQPKSGRPNWRLQMYVLRAYYDAYVQAKAAHEREQEARANAVLLTGAEPAQAIEESRTILAEDPIPAEAKKYRKKIEQLAPKLLRSIGFQLSIKPPYHARNAERGALLDTLDQPLNNRLWLETQLQEIEKLPREEQVERLIGLANWETPGEGSFYDDLGDLTQQAHLVRQQTWEQDPGGVHSPMVEFQSPMHFDTLEFSPLRLSWMDQSKTLYGTPLLMRYEGLDPAAQYTLRVVYSGRFNATMTLRADEQHLIHDALPQPKPVAPIDFDIPQTATADGTLDLKWDLVSGRGCQVAEVWLLRKP